MTTAQEWTADRHPMEFGALYRCRLRRDNKFRFAAGVFLIDDETGGQWYMAVPPAEFTGWTFTSFCPEPLYFFGNSMQPFYPLSGSNKGTNFDLPNQYVILPPKGGKMPFMASSKDVLNNYIKLRDVDRMQGDTILVRYEDLTRTSEGVFRSECPLCRDGALLMRRDDKTALLLPDDNCIACGQIFHYMDIGHMNWDEHVGK